MREIKFRGEVNYGKRFKKHDSKSNDTYEILKSFKDFKELEQFLQSFEKELNKFSMRQIIND